MRREIDLFHGHGAYYTNCIIGPFGRLLGKPSLIKASLANDDLHSLSEPRVATFHRALLSMGLTPMWASARTCGTSGCGAA